MKFRLNQDINRIEMINEVSDEVVYQYDLNDKRIYTNLKTLYVDELKMLIEEIEVYESFQEKKRLIDEQIGDLFEL